MKKGIVALLVFFLICSGITVYAADSAGDDAGYTVKTVRVITDAEEAGAVLIGEPSGGGSCCVQIGTDAEGFSYMMSSAQWQLTDSSGTDVEGGCVIDVPITAETNNKSDSILNIISTGAEVPDYEKYFDDACLSELMNEYFGSGSEELAA